MQGGVMTPLQCIERGVIARSEATWQSPGRHLRIAEILLLLEMQIVHSLPLPVSRQIVLGDCHVDPFGASSQ